MKSRKEETQEKKELKNSIIAIVGVLIILGLVIKFGMQFLINFSLNLEKSNGNTAQDNGSNTQSYIAPPSLNPVPNATNSAEISVSGYALKDEQIVLYVNGSVFDRRQTTDTNSFSFSHVPLQKGQNEIKAKAVGSNNQQSDYSQSQTVTFSNKAPSLSVDSPQDGQNITGDKTITVSGKTDPNVQVTVNDFWAIVNDQGKYSYTLTLQDGDNTIKVVATDQEGNETTKQIKVHYSH